MVFDEKLNNTASSSTTEQKEEATVSKEINLEEKGQLSKCTDDALLCKDEGKEPSVELDPYSTTDDILLKTGEYYHDHENYPSRITFKHPFMNIISLLCGLLSSLFCVCAVPAPAPLFNYIPALWLILSAFFSILGIGLFIFDLIKSKTVNGLSIAGLLASILGALVSAVTAFVIFVIFVIDKTLAILGVGATVIGLLGTAIGTITSLIIALF